MKQLSLTAINKKLYDLGEQYAQKYPAFYLSELKYIQKKAQILMSVEVQGLGSQPLRDAECERIMAETPEYEEYHKLAPEMNLISKQLWIYVTLSKNITNANWSEAQGL